MTSNSRIHTEFGIRVVYKLYKLFLNMTCIVPQGLICKCQIENLGSCAQRTFDWHQSLYTYKACIPTFNVISDVCTLGLVQCFSTWSVCPTDAHWFFWPLFWNKFKFFLLFRFYIFIFCYHLHIQNRIKIITVLLGCHLFFWADIKHS